MTKEVYGFKVPLEKINLFKNKLLGNPEIERIFGRAWIEAAIIKNCNNRTKIHPLFWIIISDDDFMNKLDVLEKSYNKFRSLIGQLKNDVGNIHSIISNIDVFYEYKLKHSEVFFQPAILGSDKESDIEVIIDGVEYWGEILTINFREEDKKQDEIGSYIKDQYNEYNETNNCVYIKYKEFIKENDKDNLVKFLLQESNKLTLSKGQKISQEFILNNKVVCEVDFFGKGDTYKKGYYAGSMFPGQFMNDDIRLKNKILDKLDKFQFPDKENIKRFFVLRLKDISVDIIDINNALFGQECVIFNTASNKCKESRNPNGIIHDPKRSEILKKIYFIVINTNDRKTYKVNSDSPVVFEFIKSNF